MHTIVFLSRLLLAGVFGIAGIGKLLDRSGSRKSMIDFGLPEAVAGIAGIALPIAEIGCVAGLILSDTIRAAACTLAVLLGAFIAAIAVNLAKGRKPNCHCFGQIHSEPIGVNTVVRNLVLLGAALLVAWQAPNAGVPSWPNLTRFEAAMVAAIVVLGAALAATLWMMVHLLRQNGRVLLRLDALEKKAGRDETVAPAGLPVGDPAPAFRLTGLDGKVVASEALLADPAPVLLVFTEIGCGACDSLLPEIGNWQKEHAGRLSIVVVSGGDLKANLAKSSAHKLKPFLLQVGREVSDAFKVAGTPGAVLLRDAKIDSPVAAGAEEIRKLVAFSVLPAPVTKGDRVPSFRLKRLDGEMVDLSSLRRRRTLILFWSPSCGFCRSMLPDLKEWERDPPPDAPELVVVTSGTVEQNRDQGFRSPVLLDPFFGAGTIFGANGTPSGVLIEDGRVASEVAVGAPDVLQLAGAPATVEI